MFSSNKDWLRAPEFLGSVEGTFEHVDFFAMHLKQGLTFLCLSLKPVIMHFLPLGNIKLSLVNQRVFNSGLPHGYGF
jgi:hypothetical protein